jgi:hypothetical protein
MAEALPGGDGFALDAILIGDDGKGITGSGLVMQPGIQNPIFRVVLDWTESTSKVRHRRALGPPLKRFL